LFDWVHEIYRENPGEILCTQNNRSNQKKITLTECYQVKVVNFGMTGYFACKTTGGGVLQ
jgi:hypothetical protein